ncbi:hypothetical protein [uncultured Vibrio sp.]|uniref:hypothetical protein n=1 Tax=uncultured Vibrio sp. TaxID=114054 RepID=UPI0025E7CAF0|nr:hypothetical protein [uncultured Vibrio sp.]
MKIFNKYIYSAALVGLFPLSGHGLEVDPGDMTKVYTQLGASIDSDSNIKLLGSMSGTYRNSDTFLLYGEASFGDADFDDEDYGADYSNGRLQYFHVMDSGVSAFPKMGFSVDYIHSLLPEVNNEDAMSIASIGLVGMVNPIHTQKLMVFPNIAYTKGTMYGEDVDGYLATLFLTRRISEDRSYIGFFPEYMSISGDGIERDSVKLKFQVGTPITDSKRLWMMTTYEHQEANLQYLNIHQGWSNSSCIEFGFKYYI